MLDRLLQWIPPDRHADYLRLLGHVPPWATRIGLLGDPCAALGYLLKKRGGHVTGFIDDAKAAAIAGEILDAVHPLSAASRAAREEPFDALLLCGLETSADIVFAALSALAPGLGPNTWIFALHGNPALGGRPGSTESLAGDVTERLANAGCPSIGRYPDGPPDAGMLHLAAPAGYDPVAHARCLRDQSLFEFAYTVLELVPPPPHARRPAALEKLAILAAWIDHDRGRDVSHLISRALDAFYLLTNESPRDPDAYLAMADCWASAGAPDMARRLLQSIGYAAPGSEIDARLAAVPEVPLPREQISEPPAWKPGRPARVLFLLHPRPHFGLDALFDGLCDCLGDENVVDFPWKPTLHGQESEAHRDYPCRYQRRGAPEDVAALVEALRAGHFDAILYGDIEGDLPQDDIRALLAAGGDCPVFLVDALDQPCNFRDLVRNRLGLAGFRGYFKREMLCNVDYGPNACPLPFAYAPPVGDFRPLTERPRPFFWAGHRQFGQRRLYLEALEARYGWNLGERFDQAEYQRRLRESRVGLNCFGMGFDTVRYWELPAHGCLLLSDRLPIQIPHNFVDGRHAVFFDTLPELIEKLDYCLAHPAEAEAIAAAGRAHFLAYHTNAARARQALGWISRETTI